MAATVTAIAAMAAPIPAVVTREIATGKIAAGKITTGEIAFPPPPVVDGLDIRRDVLTERNIGGLGVDGHDIRNSERR
jgi:hypothetical protein